MRLLNRLDEFRPNHVERDSWVWSINKKVNSLPNLSIWGWKML